MYGSTYDLVQITNQRWHGIRLFASTLEMHCSRAGKKVIGLDMLAGDDKSSYPTTTATTTTGTIPAIPFLSCHSICCNVQPSLPQAR